MRGDPLFHSHPFEFSKETSQLFIESLKENAKIHYHGCKFFKFLWDKKGLRPEDIKNEVDLEKLPFIPVHLFKEHELYTGDKKDIVLTLGSSGTSGQRSQIFLNQESLDNVKTLACRIHEELGITSQKKYNYLCFTYDPHVANDLGTAFTDELLTSFTNKSEVYYTFQFDGEKFHYDQEKTLEKLREFEASPLDTRILGFPAFLYDLIIQNDLKLDLGEDSWVQTGGGWKDQAEREIEKNLFREIVSSSLGIPKENIRDLFGMVEHGIPYVDDESGKLRIPNYSRVLIRDPKSLKVLPDGEVGLIQFICSYNTSYPSMSLLTTDYGKKLGTKDDQSLVILGRAGKKKHKGCALKALDLMQ